MPIGFKHLLAASRRKAIAQYAQRKTMTTPETRVVLETERPDAEPSLQHSPRRWWLLALLFTGMLISYAQRSALSVAVAPSSPSSMTKDLELSEASIGILLSAFFWVYSFSQM